MLTRELQSRGAPPPHRCSPAQSASTRDFLPRVIRQAGRALRGARLQRLGRRGSYIFRCESLRCLGVGREYRDGARNGRLKCHSARRSKNGASSGKRRRRFSQHFQTQVDLGVAEVEVWHSSLMVWRRQEDFCCATRCLFWLRSFFSTSRLYLSRSLARACHSLRRFFPRRPRQSPCGLCFAARRPVFANGGVGVNFTLYAWRSVSSAGASFVLL